MKTDLMMIDQFNQTQDDFMNAIVESKGNNLPVKIEQVISVFEFTDFKAKAWKMMTDKMKKLDEHSESYNSALRSGQKWGIAALYSQKRMGEITREMPVASGNRHHPVLVDKSTGSKKKKLSKKGINSNTYFEAESIANNPKILDRVIEEAKEKNEIPTKKAVLNEIRNTKAQERSDIKTDKKVVDKIKDTPKEMKKYLKANTDYKNEIVFAIEYAKEGLFSKESINILKTRHSQVRELMTDLEELL